MNEEIDKSITKALVIVSFIGTLAIAAVAFLILTVALVWEFPVVSFLWR